MKKWININDKSAEELFDLLSQQDLQNVWIHGPPGSFDIGRCLVLERVLKGSKCHLTHIYFDTNMLSDADGDEIIRLLASCLEHQNCKLKYISLALNQISGIGIDLLARALVHPNCRLKGINLSYTGIGYLGALMLAEALKHPNCELRKVELVGNDFGYGHAGYQDFADALRHPNCKLVTLYFPLKGMDVLSGVLKDPGCDLRHVVIDGDAGRGEYDLYELVKALKHPNCMLERLDLMISDHQITAYEEELLSKACRFNPFLKGVVGFRSQSAIAQGGRFLERNQMLTGLIADAMGMRGPDSAHDAIASLREYREASSGFAKDYIDLFINFGDTKALDHSLRKILQLGVMNADIAAACKKRCAEMHQRVMSRADVLSQDRYDYLAYLTCISPEDDDGVIAVMLSLMGVLEFSDDDLDLASCMDQVANNPESLKLLESILNQVVEKQVEMEVAEHLILNAFRGCSSEPIQAILTKVKAYHFSLFAQFKRNMYKKTMSLWNYVFRSDQVVDVAKQGYDHKPSGELESNDSEPAAAPAPDELDKEVNDRRYGNR